MVGAVPYGLSVTAHRRAHMVAARVFGDAMAAWRLHMPDGMFLKSAPLASSLSAPGPGSTLADYCALIGQRPLTESDAIPLDLFVQYGRWFQERHAPELERKMVECVSRAGRAFEVRLASGEELRTSVVVVASGQVPFSYTPRDLRGAVPEEPSPAGAVSHASQHADFARYAGMRVAVVGSGQSALESAALRHESGAKVQLIARTSHLRWAAVPTPARESWVRRLAKPPSDLGPGWSHRVLTDAPGLVRHLPASTRLMLMRRVLGPSGSFWLRDRFERNVQVRLETSVRSATALEGGVQLDLSHPPGGSETIEVDHVVAGMGYRIDVDTLSFLDPDLRAGLQRIGGAPVLSASLE